MTEPDGVIGGWAGGAEDVVAVGGTTEAGGREAVVDGGWKLGKYCIICWVLMPSSRSLSLSERKVIDSSFLVNFASKLVILV